MLRTIWKGNWWNHVHSSDFGFLSKIDNQEAHDVENYDILIHKQIKTGDKFPTIRYHLVSNGKTKLVENKEVKDLLIYAFF